MCSLLCLSNDYYIGLSRSPFSDTFTFFISKHADLNFSEQDREMQYFRYCIQLRYSAVVEYRRFFTKADRRQSPNAEIRACELEIDESNPFARVHYDDLRIAEKLRPYSGTLTKGALSRLKCALDVMLLVIPERNVFNTVTNREQLFRCSFITLTHSCADLVPYDVSYNLLSLFLKWLKRSKGCQMYIWKLELQQRGQIHYHVLCDSFVHWTEVREKWNRLQASAGLILSGMNPNSTDIHSLYKVGDVGSYISKYISKDAGSEDLLRKLGVKKCYGVSENLKGVKRPTIEIDTRDFDDCAIYQEVQEHFTDSFEVVDGVFYSKFCRESIYHSPISYYLSSPLIRSYFAHWRKSVDYFSTSLL